MKRNNNFPIVIFQIADTDGNQYQVPDEALSINTSSTAAAEDERLYNITWTNDAHFGLTVARKSTGTVV